MKQTQKQKVAPIRSDEVIEDMPETVVSDSTITDELLDEIETTLEDTDALSDAVLLDTARNEKVATVKAIDARSAMQSAQARAWTRGGSVD